MNPVEQYIRDYLKLDRDLTSSDYEEAFCRMSRAERDAAADVFDSDPTQMSFAEAVGRNGPFEL
ncbi:MAG TPA: hypothetical protein VLC46_18560 [Thermoanaerobaculia bacterium]|jgi:hypothetical protein|nr:hypothetical protein [Thermoanaerobaculia bacterium]